MLLARGQDVPGPELQRISLSRNVLAALLEAAIAAVYLEVGFDVVAPAIVDAFDERIEYARSGHVDSKTELQEALARTGKVVQYEVLAVEGPAHERRFVCAALIDGEQLGVGRRLDEEGGRAGGRRGGARGARVTPLNRYATGRAGSRGCRTSAPTAARASSVRDRIPSFR